MKDKGKHNDDHKRSACGDMMTTFKLTKKTGATFLALILRVIAGWFAALPFSAISACKLVTDCR